MVHKFLFAGLISLCILLGVVVLVSPGAAANLQVNSTGDAVDANPGNGQCATSGGQCTLRAAIMEANASTGADTITLAVGTYTLSIAGAGEDAAANGDLDITDTLTINGPGAIIDANDLDRVFDVVSPGITVTIRGVTIRDGAAGDFDNGGGGIRALPGTLTLEDVTLTGNTAQNYGGAILFSKRSFSDHADANSPGLLTLNNTQILTNVADSAGGGVFLGRGTSLVMNNTQIISNTARNVDENQVQAAGGGGIYVLGGDRPLSGADIISYITATGTIFRRNASVSPNPPLVSGDEIGGAIVSKNGLTSIAITGGSFEQNQSIGGGGAIYNTGGPLTINGSALTANTAADSDAGTGGAILHASGNLDIRNATFTNNNAGNQGGALDVTLTANFTIQDTDFINNSSGLDGGALAGKDNEGEITRATFRGNQAARRGGAVAVLGSSIPTDPPVLRLQDCDILSNTAESSFTPLRGGGGVDNAGLVEIVNSRIISNTSLVDGGGLAHSGFSLVVSNTLIAENVSAGLNGGGGVVIDHADPLNPPFPQTPLMYNTTIRNNRSAANGGGILHGGPSLQLVNTTISNNTATEDGGGLLTFRRSPGANSSFETVLTVINTTISGNTAGGSGGGLYQENTDNSNVTSINNATIVSNTANISATLGGGGGIAVTPPGASDSLTLRNSIIANNIGASPDISGTVISADYNLIENTTGVTITGETDNNVTGQDPRLGPLQDNGGETETHALLAGSPAIDNGNPATPGSGNDACAATDERGFLRSFGLPCDVGAFEVVSGADLGITKAATPDAVFRSNTVTFTVQVSNDGPDPATAITVTDRLPLGATFQRATGSGWSCSRQDRDVTCTRSSLVTKATSSIQIVVVAPKGGDSLENTAEVRATTRDPRPDNNSASVSVPLLVFGKPLTNVQISGTITGVTGVVYTFVAQISPPDATPPISYTWSPAPLSGQGTMTATYSFAVTGTKTISVTASNTDGVASDSTELVILPPSQGIPLAGVTISGPTSGETGQALDFTADITPTNATIPLSYTWTPAPDSGQGTATARYTFGTTGRKTITVVASGAAGGVFTDTLEVTIRQATPDIPVANVFITGPTSGQVNQQLSFTANIAPSNATRPITYTWSPQPTSGQGGSTARYTFPTAGTQTISVTVVGSAGGRADATIEVTIVQPGPGTPVTGVSISGTTSGEVNQPLAFNAAVTPLNATLPLTYTWSPPPGTGQGGANVTYTFPTEGTKTISVTVVGSAGGTATDDIAVTVTSGETQGGLFLPFVRK